MKDNRGKEEEKRGKWERKRSSSPLLCTTVLPLDTVFSQQKHICATYIHLTSLTA